MKRHSVRTLASHAPALAWVLGWMALTEVAVRTVPIDKLSRLVGVPLGSGIDPRCSSTTRPPALRGAERRRLAVLTRVGARWPFGTGPCLRQALVTGRVLRRLGPTLRIGVARTGDPILAHAWVEVGGTSIGGSEHFAMLIANGAAEVPEANGALAVPEANGARRG